GEKNHERHRDLGRRQKRRYCVGGPNLSVNSPRLPANLRRKPSSQRCNKSQREGTKGNPQEPAPPFEPSARHEKRAKPRKSEHEKAASDHDTERKEGNHHRGTIGSRKTRQPDLLAVQARGANQTTEIRNSQREAIALMRLI